MDSLEPIKQKIYEIRGRRVMLDSDLAELYAVETRTLNQAVKRNVERFPGDFMFQLTKEEWDSLKSRNEYAIALTSQNVILKKNGRGQHSKYLPFAFTREGIAMLSGLLRSVYKSVADGDRYGLHQPKESVIA